jgi:hypothetical protein
MKNRLKVLGSATLSLAALVAAGVFTNDVLAHARASTATVVATAVADVNVRARHNGHAARHGGHHRLYLYLPPHANSSFGTSNRWSEGDDEADMDERDEFESADADNDGFISLREARQANTEWARHFRRIDASGDGFLTQEEIADFYKR